MESRGRQDHLDPAAGRGHTNPNPSPNPSPSPSSNTSPDPSQAAGISLALGAGFLGAWRNILEEYILKDASFPSSTLLMCESYWSAIAP